MRKFCVLSILLLPISAVCQGPPPECSEINLPATACPLFHSVQFDNILRQWNSAGTLLARSSSNSEGKLVPNAASGYGFVAVTPNPMPKKFHWGRALLESFELLSIEQAYVLHDDWRWVAGSNSEKGIPFNHYWRDYKQSLSSWIHSGWNDGDPNMYGYVGHPIQGVAASYIYLQNDPKSEALEFSKSKAYWRSRLMATLWNAVYSTQWNIGPISEMTVEKYGTKQRPPWNQDGSWPCTRKPCYTGVGQIDLVMTPIAGFGWLVGEDILDRYVTRRVERATSNRFLIDLTRCGLDPVRVGTNILHGKKPWYRPSRDNRERYLLSQVAGESH
jgi:hypothetical protein